MSDLQLAFPLCSFQQNVARYYVGQLLCCEFSEYH